MVTITLLCGDYLSYAIVHSSPSTCTSTGCARGERCPTLPVQQEKCCLPVIFLRYAGVLELITYVLMSEEVEKAAAVGRYVVIRVDLIPLFLEYDFYDLMILLYN